MKMLVVNNFLDEVKMAFWIKPLRHALPNELRCAMEEVPYTHFTPDFVERHVDKFDAVVLSGSEAMLSRAADRFTFRNEIDAIRLLNLPVLGICAGHHMIGLAHGESIVNMGRLADGYREVEVLAEDPLFDGLPRNILVRQGHEEMITRVPRGFSLLARSSETPVEAVRRAEKGIAYGVQFHPEVNDEDHPAGKLILANFERIVSQ